jgi:predicted dehydrogenase
MPEMDFAMIGAGFWARYQIAAWQEVPGVHLVALCDLDQSKAAVLAAEFGIPRVYASAEEMLSVEKLSFVDIASGPESHPGLVTLVASRGVPIICQKPMALDYLACVEMVRICEEMSVPLLIHENYRWQAPMRKVKQLLDKGTIGPPFRAHIQFSHGDLKFFDRQPYLYRQPHFAMFDMGPHLLDLARFFLGEPRSLSAQELSVHPRFAGGDIVSIMLSFDAAYCHCELSWRTVPYELSFEGPSGTIVYYTDGRVDIDTTDGKSTTQFAPTPYAWADPIYGFAHPSIVATNAHLAQALRGEVVAETSGVDNLKTMWLLHRAVESATAHLTMPIST